MERFAQPTRFHIHIRTPYIDRGKRTSRIHRQKKNVQMYISIQKSHVVLEKKIWKFTDAANTKN